MRDREVQDMIETQFLLAYYGNISKEDSENMTPFELKQWEHLLIKQRKLEIEKKVNEQK